MCRSERFSPLDYGFSWTNDGWYAFDSKQAHAAAKAARDAAFRQLKAEGKDVRRSTDPKQLVSRGGIGSGRPHIELVINVYCLLVVE